ERLRTRLMFILQDYLQLSPTAAGSTRKEAPASRIHASKRAVPMTAINKVPVLMRRPDDQITFRNAILRLTPRALTVIALPVMTLAASLPALAQTGGGCIPASERGTREMGCFVTAREVLEQL